jgi:hypothetical protein
MIISVKVEHGGSVVDAQIVVNFQGACERIPFVMSTGLSFSVLVRLLPAQVDTLATLSYEISVGGILKESLAYSLQKKLRRVRSKQEGLTGAC